MRVLILIVTLTFSISSYAEQARDPQVEAALRLLNAMRLDEQINAIADAMRPAMTEQMKMSLGDRPLSPEAEEIVQRYAEQISEVAYTDENLEEMRLDMAAVYSEIFTVEEMDALAAFYGTDAGQALIEKMPVAMQKMMQLNMETQKRVMREAAELGREMAMEISALEENSER